MHTCIKVNLTHTQESTHIPPLTPEHTSRVIPSTYTYYTHTHTQSYPRPNTHAHTHLSKTHLHTPLYTHTQQTDQRGPRLVVSVWSTEVCWVWHGSCYHEKRQNKQMSPKQTAPDIGQVWIKRLAGLRWPKCTTWLVRSLLFDFACSILVCIPYNCKLLLLYNS